MAKTKRPADASVFFRLPSEVLNEFELLCSEQDKTKSEILRKMVESYVTSEKGKRREYGGVCQSN